MNVLFPVPQGIYALPNWVRERPNLSWDFNSEYRLDFKHVSINYFLKLILNSLIND